MTQSNNQLSVYPTTLMLLLLLVTSLGDVVYGRASAAGASPTSTSAAATQLYLNILRAECSYNGPLGLSTGSISDSQISASSTYPANWDPGCSERYGRLYQPDGRGWCAKFKTASEWLQVDLGLPAKVTGVMTQGRADGKEWVTSFVISHSLDGFNWYYIVDQYGNKRVFEGNTDSYSVKHTYLDEPILLRYIKFHTISWNRHPSMRVELIGCQACRHQIALPPYAKLQSSSEKQAGSSCSTEFGYIITDKAWCPRQQNADQWLQFDLGPPKLVTGIVTKGRGDGGKKHWVTKYRMSFSNDSRLWHFYSENEQQGIVEFAGNTERDTEHHNYVSVPFVARYVRLHPVEWNRYIALRAGLVGCDVSTSSGGCAEGFIRVNENAPCVENLAYKKESYVNSRRQHKRHIHVTSEDAGGETRFRSVADASSHGHGGGGGGGGLGLTAHGCTMMDNFYVEKPVWMVDLGKKTTISGVIIYTWSGDASEIRASYHDYIQNLDRLTVYVSGHNSHHYSSTSSSSSTHSKRAASASADQQQLVHPDSTVCGVRNRAIVATAGGSQAAPSSRSSQSRLVPVPAASSSQSSLSATAGGPSWPFPARIHVPCRQPLKGRYVFVEATGVESRWNRLFGAILCDVIVYQ